MEQLARAIPPECFQQPDENQCAIMGQLLLKKTAAAAAAAVAANEVKVSNKRRRYGRRRAVNAEEEAQREVEVMGMSQQQKEDFLNMKRLEKNRAAAQMSRRRKQAYLDGLELNVQTLCKENTVLTHQVVATSEQLAAAREHAAKLTEVLKALMAVCPDSAVSTLPPPVTSFLYSLGSWELSRNRVSSFPSS
jgi:hypothetical protein